MHIPYVDTDFHYLFGPSTSSKTVNEFTAMQTTAVYACVRILAETLAALPHQLYHLLHDEPNPEITSFIFRETLNELFSYLGHAYKVAVEEGRKYQQMAGILEGETASAKDIIDMFKEES